MGTFIGLLLLLVQIAIPVIIFFLIVWIIITLTAINNSTRNTQADVKAIRNKLAQIESEQLEIRRLIRQNMPTPQVVLRKADENVTPFTD